jgi:hypothetical protein
MAVHIQEMESAGLSFMTGRHALCILHPPQQTLTSGHRKQGIPNHPAIVQKGYLV